MAGQQEELCWSLILHSTSKSIRAEAILNAELCYSQDITNHHFVIFFAPPTLIAHATRLKSPQISIRSVQSAWHEQKEAVSCATFFAHSTIHSKSFKFQIHWTSPICMVGHRKNSALQCNRGTDTNTGQ